jgi:hypothetical protein
MQLKCHPTAKLFLRRHTSLKNARSPYSSPLIDLHFYISDPIRVKGTLVQHFRNSIHPRESFP